MPPTPGSGSTRRRRGRHVTPDMRNFTQACRLGEHYALTADHHSGTLATRMLWYQDKLYLFSVRSGCAMLAWHLTF